MSAAEAELLVPVHAIKCKECGWSSLVLCQGPHVEHYDVFDKEVVVEIEEVPPGRWTPKAEEFLSTLNSIVKDGLEVLFEDRTETDTFVVCRISKDGVTLSHGSGFTVFGALVNARRAMKSDSEQ